jgi:hypothetical protein
MAAVSAAIPIAVATGVGREGRAGHHRGCDQSDPGDRRRPSQPPCRARHSVPFTLNYLRANEPVGREVTATWRSGPVTERMRGVSGSG